MKIIKYAMMLAAAAGVISACTELDKTMTYDPSKVVAPELNALPAEIVVTSTNQDSVQLFTWNAADFGAPTQINYSIEASYNGGEKTVILSNQSGTSATATYDQLNQSLALTLGVPVDTPSDVQFYVGATVGTDQPTYYSQPVTVTMTVTAAERTYPMIYVIGDYNAWTWGTTQELFSFTGDEVNYQGVIDFGEKAANGFKISGTGDAWSDAVNWGTDGSAATPPAAEAASIQLIASGGSGNISAYSHRFYRFAFNTSTLMLTKDLGFDQLGIVGDAVGSWDVDVVMNFDKVKQRFYADVDLVAGQIKFRQDGAWDVSYGTSDTDGVLGNNGGNITVPVGQYRIYVNLNDATNMTYEFNAADYGKPVDDGTTPGGDTPPVTGVTRSIYVQDNTGWDAMTLHYWGDGITGTTWPGIESVGEKTIGNVTYKEFDLPDVDGQTIQIILNNNGAGAQTPDSDPIVMTHDYYISAGASAVTDGFTMMNFRIYIENQTGWSTLNLHSWVDGGYSTTWPGNPADGQTTIGSITYDYFNIPADLIGAPNANFIINNGTNQLPNGPVFPAVCDYYFTATPEAVTGMIYIDDQSAWDAIALYAYGDAEAFGAWPGTLPALSKTVGDITYKGFLIPADAYGKSESLIFNNNGAGAQTQAPDFTTTLTGNLYLQVTDTATTQVQP